ncbi:MAG: SWIM zinc finger family protein, partial [Smithellaceae bacterium]
MFLINRTRSLFPITIRERGRQYYESGRVEIDGADNVSVMADVRGSKPYQVDVLIKPDVVMVSCTCPYAETDYCKHIYAVFLKIDHDQLLPDLARLPNIPVRLVSYDDILDYELQDDDGAPPLLPAADARPSWDLCLDEIRTTFTRSGTGIKPARTEEKEIVYVIRHSPRNYFAAGASDLVVNIHTRSHRKNGDWGPLKPLNTAPDKTAWTRDEDLKIISILTGAQTLYDYSRTTHSHAGFILSRPLAEVVLPKMAASGRLFFQNDRDDSLLGPLQWQADEIWKPSLALSSDPSGQHYIFTAWLNCVHKTMPATEPLLLTRQGIMIVAEHMGLVDDQGAFPWLEHLRDHKTLTIPKEQVHNFIAKLYALPHLPPLSFPDELQIEEIDAEGQPCLTLRLEDTPYYSGEKRRFRAYVSFRYRGYTVPASPRTRGFYDAAQQCFILRNTDMEQNADLTLLEMGFKAVKDNGDGSTHEIEAGKFARIAALLTTQGWDVEADGKRYREADTLSLHVTTGIDWFELHGVCEFKDQRASLPALLTALKKKENIIELSDGTFGVIPGAMLKKYAFLAQMGEMREGHLRFKKSQ